MLTWNTTLRLVSDKPPRPLLIGLVLDELEAAIERLKAKSVLSEDQTYVLKGLVLKRFLLYRRLTEIIDGTAIKPRNKVGSEVPTA
jgi:hypothetical protein